MRALVRGPAPREKAPILLADEMPLMLIQPMQRVIWAKKLVKEHLGLDAVSSDKPPRQGLFSSTLFVRLEDGSNVVVQFRAQPLSIDSFMLAREALGNVVPEVIELPDDELLREDMWAYCYRRLPGKMLAYSVPGKTVHGRISAIESLGEVFSKGFVAESSMYAMEETVRPKLERLLTISVPGIGPYKPLLQQFLDRVEEFDKLPLWVAHGDLNEVNILIDEECSVTGLVGWNLSTPLPFGMGFTCLHKLTASSLGVGDSEFEDAERAFWKALFDGMEASLRDKLETQLQLVQDAATLGLMMSCFHAENKSGSTDLLFLKFLPRIITYRIPPLRGDAPPYAEPGA